MSTPLAMLHPELLDPDDIQAISRDGPRLDHAEATSKLLRSRPDADNCQGRARFRRQPYFAADDQRDFLRAWGGGCQRDGNRRGHDARLQSPDGPAGAGRLDWARCAAGGHADHSRRVRRFEIPAPARCSERWSPPVTSIVKRAVVSTGTDVARGPLSPPLTEINTTSLD